LMLSLLTTESPVEVSYLKHNYSKNSNRAENISNTSDGDPRE
jgi:hypothetical protein